MAGTDKHDPTSLTGFSGADREARAAKHAAQRAARWTKWKRWAKLGSIAVAVSVVVWFAFQGWDRRPHAPLLRGESVYQNRKEGLKFLVPENWRIQARGALPPGKLDDERMLVEYVRNTEAPATLRLSVVDLDAKASVSEFLEKQHSHSREYRSFKSEKGDTVGQSPAEHLVFPNSGQGPLKDVYAVRRGSRVYFFTGLYAKDDTLGKNAFREAVAGVVWE